MKRNELGRDNFLKALTKLEAFLVEPAVTEREQAGIIQAFEYCFETAWKCVQKKAQSETLAVGSPKKALEFALQSGLIPASEEPLWAQMLEDRNLTTHTYNQSLAARILEAVPAYAIALRSLWKKLGT